MPVFKVCPNSDPRVLTFDASTERTFTTNYHIALVDGKDVVATEGSGNFIKYQFSGAYRLKILQGVFEIESLPLIINLFYAEENLFPPEEKRISYSSYKYDDSLGLIDFYKKDNLSDVDPQNAFAKVKAVTEKVDGTTGKDHVEYKTYIMPGPISHLLGWEGNWYLGEGRLAMDYSEVYTVDCRNDCAVLAKIENEISHEYTHAIEFERGPFNTNQQYSITGSATSALTEGLADSVAVHTQYKDPSTLSVGSETADGCPYSLFETTGMIHTVSKVQMFL